MTKQYRNNGAIGALLDEYEKSILELQNVIRPILEEELIKVADPNTDDPDCKSIQTVLTHVVSCGYNYVIAIKKHLGETMEYIKNEQLNSAKDYIEALNKMFYFNEKLFQDYPMIPLEEYNNNKKIAVRWGQFYDVEQLMEHAIVHVLRHRRQIEKFRIELKKQR